MKAHAPYIPALLNAVTAAAGFEAAVKLARAFKGKRINIPRTIEPNHPIVLTIGQKGAEAVVKAAGGHRVEMPTAKATLRLMIAAEMVAKDETINAIAARTGVTWRHARRLRTLVRKLIAQGQSPYAAIAKSHNAQLDFAELLGEQGNLR